MNDSIEYGAKQNMIKLFFRASAKDFMKIPKHPIAYWLSNKTREIFSAQTNIEQIAHRVTKGIFTGNNDRFLRFWYEVSSSKHDWKKYDKAGQSRRWYGSAMHVLDWNADGHALRNFKGAGLGAMQFYDEPHLVWSGLTSGAPSFRFSEAEVWFDDVSPAIIDPQNPHFILSCLNSKVVKKILMMLNPTMHYQIGDVKQIPLPKSVISESIRASDCITIAKADWDDDETSWGFNKSQLLQQSELKSKLEAAYNAVRSHWCEITLEMQRLEEENNRIFIKAYGLEGELTPEVPLNEITLTCNPHYRYRGKKTDEELEELLLADTMREFISYAVGCMFGRYSLDKPGLVLANQGETLADYLAQIPKPTFTPDEDNVIPILDGEWFSDDITERFRQFLRVTFGDEHYDDNLHFIEKAIGRDIRRFFLRDFYNDHVKRYKKRPIYWLFSSPQGTFNALIYMHRYQPHTVGTVLGYLRDFRKKLDAHLQHLGKVSISTDVSQGEKTRTLKDIDKLKKQILELDDYERDTLYPLATQQIAIDLDDGVKANYPKFGSALKRIVGLEAKDDD